MIVNLNASCCVSQAHHSDMHKHWEGTLLHCLAQYCALGCHDPVCNKVSPFSCCAALSIDHPSTQHHIKHHQQIIVLAYPCPSKLGCECVLDSLMTLRHHQTPDPPPPVMQVWKLAQRGARVLGLTPSGQTSLSSRSAIACSFPQRPLSGWRPLVRLRMVQHRVQVSGRMRLAAAPAHRAQNLHHRPPGAVAAVMQL